MKRLWFIYIVAAGFGLVSMGAGCGKRSAAAGPLRSAELEDEQGINLRTGKIYTFPPAWIKRKEQFPETDLGWSDVTLLSSPKATDDGLVFGRIVHLGKVSFADVSGPPKSAGNEPICLFDLDRGGGPEVHSGRVFLVECQDSTWAKVRLVRCTGHKSVKIEWQLLR